MLLAARSRLLCLPLLAALALLASMAAACSPPLQNGGVAVLPGAAERLDAMCRFRHGSAQGDLCTILEEEEPAKPEAPAPVGTLEPSAPPPAAPTSSR